MRMGSYSLSRGDGARRILRNDEAPRLSMRTTPFTPERKDLRTVQAYLEREIKRLHRRHAEITRRLASP